MHDVWLHTHFGHTHTLVTNINQAPSITLHNVCQISRITTKREAYLLDYVCLESVALFIKICEIHTILHAFEMP